MSQKKSNSPEVPQSNGPTVRKAKISTEEFQVQIDQLTEALQRERADSANIRRRHEEQMAGLRDMAKASVVRELLPVIDNFERALKHLPFRHPELDSGSSKNESSIDWIPDQVRNDKELLAQWQKLIDYIKGVQGVVKQFETTLANIGVERIKTAGETFDPHLHEAVSMDEEGDGTHEVISEELQAGYKLGSDILRPAMVRVKRQK